MKKLISNNTQTRFEFKNYIYILKTEMKLFNDYLIPDIEDIRALPLLHNCSAEVFLEILKTGALKATDCKVFTEKLLYAYYGTPSYRLSFKGSTSKFSNFMVCFIIDGEKVNGLHRMYPFDSGAYKSMSEFRQIFVDEDTDIDDFRLNPVLDSAKRVIKTFYKSNKNYIEEKPDINIKIEDDQNSLGSYKKLIEYKKDSKFDSRKSTIELIFNKDIKLASGIIKQIIIPKNYLDDSEVIKLIKNKMGIDLPLTYRTCTGSPNDFFGAIREKYLDFENL